MNLNLSVINQTPSDYLAYTENYWRAWVNKNEMDFADLSPEIVEQYKRSLLIVRTQTDNDGAILAANDSDVTIRATDHYSYLWTRDGAFVANALDLAGYPALTRPFFDFCDKIAHPNGYFLQKYNSDGTVASGWHAAWDVYGKKQLVPIQEDETALVIWALWEHYDRYRDIEFVHRLYRNLVVKCADFMVGFRHEELNLPFPSWNLWEDRRGIHTFTVASVIGGLRAAANFARLFAETERAEIYETGRRRIYRSDARTSLQPRARAFSALDPISRRRSLRSRRGVDASMFGIFYFGVFDIDDEMVKKTMRAIEKNLWVKGEDRRHCAV